MTVQEPGRRDNLTPEEEIKLREFWAVLLDAFGVHRPSEVAVNGTATPNGGDNSTFSSESNTPTEKKKRRFGFFSRSKSDKDFADESPTSAPSPVSPVSPSSAVREKFDQNKEFKKALAHPSPEAVRAAFWSMMKHDHPDTVLLRFLRARKWEVDEALVMLVAAMEWRSSEIHVDDDVIKKGEAGALEDTKSSDATVRQNAEDFLTQMRMGKSYCHGTDKEGRPMCVVRVRLHEKGQQTEASLERFTVYTIETARFLLDPPVDTACLIFDMTGFSMANMDYGPVKFMIKCFEANYPESLGVVLVHKAPWIFQSIWVIIRGWLDPVVAGKTHFTKSLEELEEYVARDHIPKELGGDEDWDYQFVEPVADENRQMSDTESIQRLTGEREKIAKDFEAATIKWVTSTTDQTELEPVKSERNQLAEKLRSNYWQLDPHVRARSLYDRLGVIKPGGKLDFYPATSKGEDNKAPVVDPQTDEVD